MNSKLRKWIRWIKAINDEIQKMKLYRYIFWEVQGIIKNNVKLHKPSAFKEFLAHNYGIHILMMIRRQCKSDKQSISVRRLLEEMKRSPEIVTRDYFVSLYKPSTRELGNEHFDSYAGQNKDYVSPESIEKDLADLKSQLQKCEKFADRTIAHIDIRKGSAIIPTFADLDRAIDFLVNICNNYHVLLTAESYYEGPPIFQYDWKAIFRVPWIENRQS
ncbi:MAG: hypothetical protein V3T99_00475 [Nitrososphaerales archaeon]